MNNVKLLSTLTLAFSVTLAGAQETAPTDVGEALALLSERGAVYGVERPNALSRDEAARLLHRLLRGGVLTSPSLSDDEVISAALNALAPELVVLRAQEGPSSDPTVAAVEDRLARLAGNAAAKAAPPAAASPVVSPDLARLTARLEALEARAKAPGDLFGSLAARTATSPVSPPAPYVDVAVTPSAEGLNVSATLGSDDLLGAFGGRVTGAYRAESGELEVDAALTKRFGSGGLEPYVGLGGGVKRERADARLGAHMGGFVGLDVEVGGLSVFGEVGAKYDFGGSPIKTTSRIGLRVRL